MSRVANPMREQARLDFSRPIVIHVCKDGTMSYRAKGEPVFNGFAIPVFSVDTIEQALDAQVMFGRKQYVDHPQLPGRPWYKWTDFPGTVGALDEVTAKLRAWFYEQGGELVAMSCDDLRPIQFSPRRTGVPANDPLPATLGMSCWHGLKLRARWRWHRAKARARRWAGNARFWLTVVLLLIVGGCA